MSKDYFKRKKKDDNGNGGSASPQANQSGAVITQNLFNALEYHPTNAMPTTPVIGGKLTPIGDFNYQDAVPGFLRVTYTPVMGSNSFMSSNSTLQNVPRNIWSSLRNFCTTAVNYQPGDVLNVLFQIGLIPSQMSKLKRMMRSVYVSNTATNIYDRQLFFVCNTSAQNEARRRLDIQNMNDYVAEYNAIVQLYNSIACPDFFPIFKRWEYLNGEVFSDVDMDTAEGQKFAQYIVFDDEYMYVTHMGDPSVPGSEMVPFQNGGTIRGQLDLIQATLNNMWDDTSLRMILGDIRATYGDSDLRTIDPITMDDITDWKATYDPEVLYALYNATVLPITVPTLNVNAETGMLEGFYRIDGGSAERKIVAALEEYAKVPKLFNAQKWGVDVQEFAKFTQWTYSQPVYQHTTGIQNPGPELITGLEILGFDYENGAQNPTFKKVPLGSNHLSMNMGGAGWSEATMANFLGKMCGLRAFAWAPFYTIYAATYSGDEVATFRVIGYDAELEVPVVLDYRNLYAWHDAIRESLWGLPKKIEFKVRGQK